MSESTPQSTSPNRYYYMTPILLCFRNAEDSETSHAAYQTAHRLVRELSTAIFVGYGYVLPDSGAFRTFLNALNKAGNIREEDLAISVFELGTRILLGPMDHFSDNAPMKLQELGIDSFPLGFPRLQKSLT